jgi:aldose 1-epimerase
MKINKSLFGTYQEEEVFIYEMENDSGMIVKTMTFGATITSVSIPGAKGADRVELVCGFDRFGSYFTEEYMNNSPYFGCTIGRYCSHIKDAEFYVDGIEYLLAANLGDNNLHGGVRGFDKKIWNSESFEAPDAVGVIFSTDSPNREEGFPGNVRVAMKMELNNSNEIIIDYKATTDKPTPISLANHSYFNLSGFEKSIESHVASVFTNKLQILDESGTGTGEISTVDGTDEDLQKGRVISDAQEAIGGGFEHFYVFDNPEFELRKVAEIKDPKSGRSLEVFSKEPCLLYSTGGNISDELSRESGQLYGKYRGIACVTQRHQNGPNIPNSPGTISAPGKPFESTSMYKLNW